MDLTVLANTRTQYYLILIVVGFKIQTIPVSFSDTGLSSWTYILFYLVRPKPTFRGIRKFCYN